MLIGGEIGCVLMFIILMFSGNGVCLIEVS